MVLRYILYGFFVFGTMPVFSQNSTLEFSSSLMEFSVITGLSEKSRDTTLISLTILKKDSTFIYYNYRDKSLFVFSNKNKESTLKTEVDTLLYIHYYIHIYAFETEWGKTFKPYSLCPDKVRRAGNCVYHYNHTFTLFNRETISKFAMVKGAVTELILSYGGKQRTLMKSTSNLFK